MKYKLKWKGALNVNYQQGFASWEDAMSFIERWVIPNNYSFKLTCKKV